MGGKNTRATSTRPQLVDESQFSTSQEDVPVALQAGERLVPIKWISRTYGLRPVEAGGGGKGGKGGGGGGTHNYYGTVVGCFGHGPYAELVAILQDGASVWPNATPWAAGSFPANSIVYYLGNFYRTPSTTTAVPPAAPWVRYSLASSTMDAHGYTSLAISFQGTTYGTMHLGWGTLTQDPHALLTNAAVVGTEIHPSYAGRGILILDDFLFGQDRQDPPNLQAILRRVPAQTLVTGTPATLTDGQANVMAFTAELLTEPRYALGIDAGKIDAPSIQTAADTLEAQAALAAASPLLDRQTTLRGVGADAQAMTDAWLRWNHGTAKVEAGVWLHGTAPTTYATVTMQHLTQRPKITEAGWPDANTGGIVNFNDRDRLYKQTATPPAVDLRARDAVGEPREPKQERPWVTRYNQASAQAAEWLRYNGRPPASVELRMRRAFALGTGVVGDPFRDGVRPGDWIRLDIDPEPGGTQLLQFCRVQDRRIPRTGEVSLIVTADPTLTPIVYNPPANALPLTQPNDPAAVAAVRIVDCPPSLADGSFGTVLVLAQRAERITRGVHLLFDSTIDPDSAFDVLGQQLFFTVKASLEVDLADDALSDADELEIDATPAASVLRLSVADQVDGDLFNHAAPGTQGAANDQLLLILVALDGDQVAEDAGGFPIMEVLSVAGWTAYGGGSPATYALDAWRARRGTAKQAFTAADTEAWLISRDALSPLTHADFATLRRNRALGDSPDSGTFRVQPFTANTVRPEALCDDVPFRWPVESLARPTLSLEAPGETVFPHTFATSAGGSLRLAGRFFDADANLTGLSVIVTAPDGSVSTLISQTLNRKAEAPFDVTFNCAASGTWRFTAAAVDTDGLSAQTTVEAVVPEGASQVATPTCAPPGWSGYGSGVSVTLACATAGATIYFRTDVYGGAGGGPWTTYTGPMTVSRMSLSRGRRLFAYAAKTGLGDSEQGFWDFEFAGR